MTSFLEVTILETSFTSGLAIFFCLDIKHSHSLAFVFVLINTSNILICYEGFPDFLQLCLTNVRDAKNARIEGICIETFYTRSGNLMSKNGYIYGSAHKPSKSFV